MYNHNDDCGKKAVKSGEAVRLARKPARLYTTA